MKILITGGCGFLGSNLSAEALKRGHSLAVLDNLSRLGATDNRAWLEGKGSFRFAQADIRDTAAVAGLVKEFAPDAVFHLAGQVAMTTSIADPRADFDINALGTLNVLEALRAHAPKALAVYSSTNKVYGDLEQYAYLETATRYECTDRPAGFGEDTPLEFHSPYGCSKGAADQYMLDYARIFGLRTAVLRHSSMYGGRQFSTYDQGWIGWFCQQALETKRDPGRKPFTVSGTGKQVRDVLHADDMIALYFRMLETPDAVVGRAFNIGGGMANSLSLLELFAFLQKELGVTLKVEHLPPRESDQRVFVADLASISRAIGWRPQVSHEQGVRRMLDWLRQGA